MAQQKLTKKQNIIQTIKFALFSAGAGIIQTVSFTLLNEVFKLDYWAAYLPALVLSVLFNFTVNRKFTFKSAANVPVAMLKVAGYYCVFTPLSTWGGDALKAWLDVTFASTFFTSSAIIASEYCIIVSFLSAIWSFCTAEASEGGIF